MTQGIIRKAKEIHPTGLSDRWDPGGTLPGERTEIRSCGCPGPENRWGKHLRGRRPEDGPERRVKDRLATAWHLGAYRRRILDTRPVAQVAGCQRHGQRTRPGPC